MRDSVEHLVVGAGPGGLRAAQVLAEAGREVLVAERHETIGPKTCAGGLTPKAAGLLASLGLPDEAGRRCHAHARLAGGPLLPLDAGFGAIRTVSRAALGHAQRAWTERAGATVVAAAPVSRIDLAARTAHVGGRPLRFRHLIGADGADSRLRQLAGLPAPRAYFACEYNVPGTPREPLFVECDPHALANGYFWVFPHDGYTSIGAGAPTRLVPPPQVRAYVERRMRELGVPIGAAPFEGATIEVDYRGLRVGDVHLVGDAAGLPSALTAEGIYPALVSGEAVARAILEPGAPTPALDAWLRLKRAHDRIARLIASRAIRLATLPLLARAVGLGVVRRAVTRFYVGEAAGR